MITEIKVWDIAVRVFHWSLTLCLIISFLTGDVVELAHVYSGYIIIVLLILRVAWGFVGTRYARFSNFIYSPKTIIRYFKLLSKERAKNYIGHNPVGGAMILLMLISLAFVTWTGLKAYAVDGKGPLASVEISIISDPHADDNDRDSDDREKSGSDHFWEDVHEISANIMLLIVFFHIGGVLITSEILKVDLIRPMITGYKKPLNKERHKDTENN